jgi:hypothetical protein
MQIRFAAFVAVVMYFWNAAEATAVSSLCRKWECQLGVGQGQTGATRLCSVGNTTQLNGTVGVEACQPAGYLCDAPVSFIKNETCYSYGVLPWKKQMPAGDSCTDNAQCATGSCNTTGTTKTCSGKNLTDACTLDQECYPGLFCNQTSKKCDNVSKVGAVCNSTLPCEFGTFCANGTCTQFGTFDAGKRFFVNDTTSDFGKLVDTRIMRLCKTFWAESTGVLTDDKKFTMFECTKGRALKDAKSSRGIGDDDQCQYNVTFANGTSYQVAEPAICGYNTDGMYYCPKRRAEVDYKSNNDADVSTWGGYKDLGCHHLSTIQYCRKIEDNPVISLGFRLALKSEMERDVYPLIAKNDKCVGEAITTTLNYYRVIDSAYTLQYYALVAGFFILALLY